MQIGLAIFCVYLMANRYVWLCLVCVCGVLLLWPIFMLFTLAGVGLILGYIGNPFMQLGAVE